MSYSHPKVSRTVTTTVPIIVIVACGLLLTRNLSIFGFLFALSILAISRARQYWDYASVSVDTSSIEIDYYLFIRRNRVLHFDDQWHYKESRLPADDSLLGGHFFHPNGRQLFLDATGITDFETLNEELRSKFPV